MQLPEQVRAVIEARAGAVTLASLQRATKALSDRYRDRGGARAFSLRPDERAAAYLTTRFPATYAAAFAVLLQVRTRIGDEITSILDRGHGAATLAAREMFVNLRQATLVEADAPFIEAGRELLPDATWVRADLRRERAFKPHDLVIASYALGELAQADAVAVADAAWGAAQNSLVLIEPGAPRAFPLVLGVRPAGSSAARISLRRVHRRERVRSPDATFASSPDAWSGRRCTAALKMRS